MPCLAAVYIVLACLIGPPPSIDRANGGLYPSQGAPQNAVQTSCPTLLELEAGPSTPLQVFAPVDRVWRKIGEALDKWSNPTTPPDPKLTLRKGAVLLVEQGPVQISEQQPASNIVGRTCFYEWRTGYTDTRIAFKFSARAMKGTTPSTALEVRWLSQTKGSAQRTWRNSSADQGLLSKLFELLRGISATETGRAL